MLKIEERLQQKLIKRKNQSNLRTLSISHEGIDFFSNDYLGLARSQALAARIQEQFSRLKPISNGSTGSRLLSGNTQYAMELESELAIRYKAGKVLLFNSGYTANLALISTIPQKGDTIIYDQLSHACIKEAARLSLAGYFSFHHNDPDDLIKKLIKAKGTKFVVVESLYSMDGNFSPIDQLIDICNQYKAHLIVDEAHTSGWIGQGGGGLVVDRDMEQQVLARVHTFGKALGVHGACVAGPSWLIDYLINFARPFIYTTALPMHSLVAIKCAHEHIDQHLELAEKLVSNIAYYGEALKQLENKVPYNEHSPIQKIILGGNDTTVEAAAVLMDHGLNALAVLPPTVKKAASRIRICLHAHNSKQQLDQLVKALSLII